jgi:hypothetical protein
MNETEKIKQIISASKKQLELGSYNYTAIRLLIYNMEIQAIIAEQLAKIIEVLKEKNTNAYL